MKKLGALLLCLTVGGCDLDGLRSLTSAPAARFQIVQQMTADPGTDVFCGVDATGLGDGQYNGLAEDVLIVGHRVSGANNRCREDVLRRMNGYAGFDLSALGGPPDGARREITSALLAYRISPAPDADGGVLGCRRSTTGVGMLDNVFWVIGTPFFPQRTPDLSNPPATTMLSGLQIEGREVRLNEWFLAANPAVEFVGKSRGAATMQLDARAVTALQAMVDDSSLGLRRFGLYFVGTNSGTLSSNQVCTDHVENIRLTVFYRDRP
ncbi:hypothetical protein [Lentibacter sp. XHP0401]|uniref:hypothetical protein n=1 Tax=Lentibacter sp. XHP0401 TaxID=2984334 RepID=UPI0021E821F1|nr:hypothetical protein [Lentibacter sp. XHP0401]MCV2893293.1 hypothetical protein [Lentibacter sp. XHP0401]